MSAHCSAPQSVRDYYVVMCDLGRRGREAVVDPELTRREVVDRIRTKQYGTIAFIDHIHDDERDDVTNALLHEAGFYSEPTEHDRIMSKFDALIASLDHKRDHAKNL
jgi:hypothetical protein